MIKVITYGTFDLLHNGHINLLKRAKALGNYLIVGITSETYDMCRGKLNVQQSLSQRIENVKNTGLADEIIVEEYLGQKISDIQKYQIDKFVIGSDWLNKFDYLKEFCEVIYLPRTKGISSTQIRNNQNKILKIGVIGYGRIANRFITEAKYVSGINVDCVFGLNKNKLHKFVEKHELKKYYTDIDKFYDTVDAVYIASPHTTHFNYAKSAILKGKHVLCEKPITLLKSECDLLFSLAKEKNVIVYEAIKTAFAPCFNQLIGVAKSGLIGNIKNVTATFTKLIKDKSLREYNSALGGGAFNELSSYPLLSIVKILGTNYNKINYTSVIDKETNVDILTQANFIYQSAIATATTAIGSKQEGDLIISGTQGYIYVPAPWWKTEYFEVRFENTSENLKYFNKFDLDGLRYEIADFLSGIHNNKKSHKLTDEESCTIASIIEEFNKKLKSKKGIDIIYH